MSNFPNWRAFLLFGVIALAAAFVWLPRVARMAAPQQAEPVAEPAAETTKIISVSVLKTEKAGGGSRVHVRVTNYTDVFVSSVYVRMAAYDSGGDYLGRALIHASNLQPWLSSVETAYLLSVEPHQVARWEPQLGRVANAQNRSIRGVTIR